MRSWTFTLKNNEDAEKIFNGFAEMFKDSEDMKKKNIFYCRLTGEDGTYKVHLALLDKVNGTFNLTYMNAFDQPFKLVFTAIKSDCKDINIEIPADCGYATIWEPDPVKKENK